MKVYRSIDEFKAVQHPIVTVGTFDGVHVGHQQILSRLKEISKQKEGEAVLLTFFPHPRMVIFPHDNSLKLINTLEEKIELLEQYGLDHLVILPFSKTFSRISPIEYVRNFLVGKLNIDTIVIGYDHRFGRNREGDINLLKELSPVYSFNVEEISAQEIDAIKVSSTKIRQALEKGDIKTATGYLKHYFSLSGTVVEGEQLGRTIGFPTANIKVKEDYKLIPARGVYIIKAEVEKQKYNGILNIGQRPTVNQEDTTTIEAHLFDTGKNLYGKTIKIDFLERIRDEKKYSSVEELKQQLQEDKQYAEEYFNELV